MDITRFIILDKRERDITARCELCNYNKNTGYYDVKFNDGKIYNYNKSSLKVLTNPETISIKDKIIFLNEKSKSDIDQVLLFTDKTTKYWRIVLKNGKSEIYHENEIRIAESCMGEKAVQEKLTYLKELAQSNGLISDDGHQLLSLQYKKLKNIETTTALAVYLEPNKYANQSFVFDDFIYPFGVNASQIKAVQNAFRHQISVIQGPPGTGKTQTILNIIANLLVQNKTVQVVSNNNSAIENVLEKLADEKYDLSFLAALLGNNNNRVNFIANQPPYPDFAKWRLPQDQQLRLKQNIVSVTKELGSLLKKQETLAVKRRSLDEIKLEFKYFERYCHDTNVDFSQFDYNLYKGVKPENVLSMWGEVNHYIDEGREKFPFWYFIKGVLWYGIGSFSFYRKDLHQIVPVLQRAFYLRTIEQLEKETGELETALSEQSIKGKLQTLTELSLSYFHAKLAERFSKEKRPQFVLSDLQNNSVQFLKEYPVVLSTTFSSKRNIDDSVMFDYIIMDEASQVDIPTGALALSTGYNAVIVGDLKQLPNVITKDVEKYTADIFSKYQFLQGYSYSNNFLQSVCKVLPDVPETLLREHYRCHPKIIGFCNQKFYQNQLVIMTEDHGEDNVLSVYKTSQGNHQRGFINQRQIDVLMDEVFPTLPKTESKGIIAPYRKQVCSMQKTPLAQLAEIDTVHKFQGRDKDEILFTTVDDIVNDFSDDAHLLNVAISRAKKRFVLIVSGDEQPEDSNIGQLISYIQYNNFEIVNSKIYSVFDYLYKQFAEVRISFLQKHAKISEYDSENLMFNMLRDVIKDNPQLTLELTCHTSLQMLIRDAELLTEEERLFKNRTGSHIDFLLYNKISKKPVLAIEVDGFAYHHNGGEQQQRRDRLKNSILRKYNIPLLRLATNGSQERLRIEIALGIRKEKKYDESKIYN